MKVKNTAAILGVVVLAGLIFHPHREKSPHKLGYIFDRQDDIPVEAVVKIRKKTSAEEFLQAYEKEHTGDSKKQHSEANGRIPKTDPLLSGETVTHNTLRFFKFLNARLGMSSDTEVHLEKVLEYFTSYLPRKTAEKLFSVYGDYLRCETDLADEMNSWSRPEIPEDLIDRLSRAQEFRRGYMGVETADILFGAEIKSREYALRRAMIVCDGDMYGSDKTARLTDLNEDMWGEDAGAVEALALPFNRYREKLRIYSKDFGKLSDAEDRLALEREFREEIFPVEVVERLDMVDKHIAAENAEENSYRVRANETRNNTELAPEEKEQKIERIRSLLLGDRANAVKRREAIQAGLEKLRHHHEKQRL